MAILSKIGDVSTHEIVDLLTVNGIGVKDMTTLSDAVAGIAGYPLIDYPKPVHDLSTLITRAVMAMDFRGEYKDSKLRDLLINLLQHSLFMEYFLDSNLNFDWLECFLRLLIEVTLLKCCQEIHLDPDITDDAKDLKNAIFSRSVMIRKIKDAAKLLETDFCSPFYVGPISYSERIRIAKLYFQHNPTLPSSLSPKEREDLFIDFNSTYKDTIQKRLNAPQHAPLSNVKIEPVENSINLPVIDQLPAPEPQVDQPINNPVLPVKNEQNLRPPQLPIPRLLTQQFELTPIHQNITTTKQEFFTPRREHIDYKDYASAENFRPSSEIIENQNSVINFQRAGIDATLRSYGSKEPSYHELAHFNNLISEDQFDKYCRTVNSYFKSKPFTAFSGRGDPKTTFTDLKTTTVMISQLQRWKPVHIFIWLTRYALTPALATRVLTRVGNFPETGNGYSDAVESIWAILAHECQSSITLEKEYQLEESLKLEIVLTVKVDTT